MRRGIVVTIAIMLALAGSPARAERTLEVGLERAIYSGAIQNGFSQFAAYSWSEGPLWTFRLDVSHDARFGDEGFGAGLGATRSLGKFRLNAGLSSGTSDVIHPEYRCDLGLSRDLLLPGLQATVGYTRLQSKGENSADGFAAGLNYWFGGHWILGASGRHEIGHPGDTTSESADLSLTWFRWQRLYLGAGYRFGAISYQLLGPAITLVDYDETDIYATASWYVRPEFGFNGRLDRLENDVYDLTAVRLSAFWTW